MIEENLALLFRDLLPMCLVIIEDIDTIGLTHNSDQCALFASLSRPR
jgi:hypothetical protein